MQFNPGDTVWFWHDAYGSPQKGTVGYMQSSWGSPGITYAVNFDSLTGLGRMGVYVYLTSDRMYRSEIEALKSKAPKLKCECGAEKLGHPGHSHYCPMEKK